MSVSALSALRQELLRQGLDGFIVPRADEHLGEYVPASAERLAWLTGFTGSAGLAVVLGTTAAVFTDGRYVLQLAEQTDVNLWQRLHITEQPLPLDLREFLQQLLDFLIALHALADALFPLLGHEHLARLTPLALHDVQRQVQFAVGTTTVRLPAPAPTRRQGAAEKTLAGDDLRQARTAFPLAGRKTGAG